MLDITDSIDRGTVYSSGRVRGVTWGYYVIQLAPTLLVEAPQDSLVYKHVHFNVRH